MKTDFTVFSGGLCELHRNEWNVVIACGGLSMSGGWYSPDIDYDCDRTTAIENAKRLVGKTFNWIKLIPINAYPTIVVSNHAGQCVVTQ